MDEAQQQPGEIKRLRDFDAAPDRAVGVRAYVGTGQLAGDRQRPGEVDRRAAQKDVGPVERDGETELEKIGEHARRERQGGYGGEKEIAAPSEIAVGAFELV